MNRDPLSSLFEALDRTRHLDDAQIDEMTPTARLLDQIGVGTLRSKKSFRKRFWRRGVVISTVAVLVIGSAATAITLSRRPVDTVAHMTCYRSDSLSSTADVVSYAVDPLAVCSQVMHWKGSFKGSARGNGTLCLLSDGSLAAFPPSRKFKGCSALGLATFNGQLANSVVAKFQLAVERLFVDHECQSVMTARHEVHQLIRSYGLSSWKLRFAGSTSTRACATLAFEIKPKVVDIVGVLRQVTP